MQRSQSYRLASSAQGSSSRKKPGPHIHGPARRGANGAAMPTDEGDQDGHFFFNHPERRATPLPRPRSHCYCCLNSIPSLRGGAKKLVAGNAVRRILPAATPRTSTYSEFRRACCCFCCRPRRPRMLFAIVLMRHRFPTAAPAAAPAAAVAAAPGGTPALTDGAVGLARRMERS